MTNDGQSVRSFQELCATRLQGVILNSDTADDDFASLEPRIQMLLFNSLRTEKARLRDVEETDRFSLRTIWKYKSKSDKDDVQHQEWLEDFGTEWTEYELRLDHSDIKSEFLPHLIQAKYGQYELPKLSVDKWISSQLLIYRINATFGMPQTSDWPNIYMPRREWCLIHRDTMSKFRFWEAEGRPKVHFNGTDGASEDARRLLNYLVFK
jgi:hypothetical protein